MEEATSSSPDSTVLKFLKWYHLNENRLNTIYLIKGGLPDTTTTYSIDFKNTEIYLAELHKSECLSDKFISDFRNFFVQADLNLKANPQNDGPADGFDADLIMKSQDYMDVWDNLDSMKLVMSRINGDSATIKVRFGLYYMPAYNLSKHANRWVIDSIYNVYSEN